MFHEKSPIVSLVLLLSYQRDKAAATATIPFAQFAAEELEVDMFEEEEQPSEQHAAGEQDEGTREVEYS